jgi:hypothetical protein
MTRPGEESSYEPRQAGLRANVRLEGLRSRRPVSVTLIGAEEDQRIIWSWRLHEGKPAERNYVIVESDILWSFMKLKGAPTGEILEFARTRGVLDLCQWHWLPASHNPPWAYLHYDDYPFEHDKGSDPKAAPFCRPEPAGPGWYSEPVLMWRLWAAQIEAMLNLARALRSGELDRTEDWDLVAGSSHPWRLSDTNPDLGGELLIQKEAEEKRRWLAAVANQWLWMARIVPIMELESGTPASRLDLRIRARTDSLFGAIVAQLVAALTADGWLARCSRCGSIFQMSRKPRSDRANYCDLCAREAKKAAVRESVRRRRARLSQPVDSGDSVDV